MPGLASLDFLAHSALPPPNLPGFAPLRGLNGRCEGNVNIDDKDGYRLVSHGVCCVAETSKC